MWEGKRHPGESRRRYARWSAALTAFLVVVLTGAAGPAAATPSGVSVETLLELAEDGAVGVVTTITAPQGKPVSQRLPLDVPVEGNRTQHYTLSDVKADNGTAAIADGALQVSAPGGVTRVTFTVHGAVADGPELQQFTWPIAAGYTVDLDTVTMRFSSPTPAPDSPQCGYGQVGERRMCTLTQTDASGTVTARQNGLARGKVAVFTTLLPAGTAKADARFTTTTAAAPDRDTAGLIALSVATILAVALGGYALLRRRSDAAAADSAGATADLLVPGDGGVAFASPDGVLPGQIGTLLDDRLRATDLASTVLDLAVRGYLWLAALPGGDFQLSRRAPLDDAVTPAERAVVSALLPDGAETVTVGELTTSARAIDLTAVSAQLREDVTARGWLRRTRLFPPALAVAALGTIASVICGFLATGVLYALAVLILGVGLVVAALAWPRRTVAGSRLAAGVGGMRQELIATNVGALPDDRRAVLFERALPYAHAFGELRGWLGTWGGTSAPLDWYRSAQGPVAGLAAFAAALDGVAAQAQAAQGDR